MSLHSSNFLPSNSYESLKVRVTIFFKLWNSPFVSGLNGQGQVPGSSVLVLYLAINPVIEYYIFFSNLVLYPVIFLIV